MDNFTTFVTFIDQWAWIGWLVLIAVFLVIEMLSLDFTFLMLSFGSVVGLVTDLIGVPVWLQVIIAAAAAALFILFLRPRSSSDCAAEKIRPSRTSTPSSTCAVSRCTTSLRSPARSSSPTATPGPLAPPRPCRSRRALRSP